MKFRKKPVVIEAMQFMGPFSVDEMILEWGDPFTDVASYNVTMNELQIETLEGIHRANHLDWIIKGVKGEFYPCKPDIFAMTYEPLEESGHS